MNRFVVGVVGSGSVSEYYHLPVLERMSDVTLSWICDVDKQRAEKVAKIFGVRTVVTSLTDCPSADVVLAAVPVGSRAEIVEHAVLKGWHLMCEKPFARTLAEHTKFVGLMDAAGLRIGVGLMRRYYTGTLSAERIVASNVLGPPIEVFAGEGGRLRSVGRESGWYQENRSSAGGGTLIETGSHLVDQVFQIMGIRSFRLLDYEQTLIGEVEYDARANAILTGPCGEIPARFVLSKMKDIHTGICIRFSDSILRLGVSPSDLPTLTKTNGDAIGQLTGVSSGAEDVFSAFAAQWQEFLREVRTGQVSRATASTASLSTAFIDECYARSTTPAVAS